jgi:hypothetical protein
MRIAGGNSLNPKTMLPAMLAFYTLFSVAYLLVVANVKPLLLLPWLAYLAAVLGVFLETAIRFNVYLGLGTLLFTAPSHFWYGLRYIEGTMRTTVRPQLH